MGFFQSLTSFFESLFNKTSPESQKKLLIRKMEADIKGFQPVLYKNGTLLPNFAEAIRILYQNTKPLDDIFAVTINGNDIPRRRRFESQLVLTGYSVEDQEIIEKLSYEKRKQEVVESQQSESRIFEQQHRQMDKIIHSLNDDSFKKMDKDLVSLHQLSDLCKFNFVTILQLFDRSFTSVDLAYEPSYQAVPMATVGTAVEDLYYLTATLQINTSVANAILALAQLKNGGTLSNEASDSLMINIKRIAYVITHILTQAHLHGIICLYREDSTYQPKTVSYNESARQNFALYMQDQFKADEQRIKTELKDERIKADLNRLFGDTPLSTLAGYNADVNGRLQANSAVSFMWITPLQTIKTFINIYFTDQIKTLINDIVIEGFFNNPTYKTEFSATVYSAMECDKKLQAFEDSFQHEKPNDVAVLESFMRDSHKDADFYKKMENMVNTINTEAKQLIQDEANYLHSLFIELGELLTDAKKPNSEIISNIKVLMMSSRNRDNTDLLEQQYPNWQIFFEIMKNYAIINIKEMPT